MMKYTFSKRFSILGERRLAFFSAEQPEQPTAEEIEAKRQKEEKEYTDSLDDLHGALSREVNRRELAGRESGALQFEELAASLQKQYDANLRSDRFRITPDLQLTWVRNMNADLRSAGRPYQISIVEGRVWVRPLPRVEQPPVYEGVRYNTAQAFEDRMEAQLQNAERAADIDQPVAAGPAIESDKNGTYATDSRELMADNTQTKLKEGIGERDPSEMTEKERNKIAGRVMMETGSSVVWNPDKKAFDVTPPDDRMQRLVNMISGAVTYISAYFGKKESPVKFASQTEAKEGEPSKNREEREKELRAELEEETEEEIETYLAALNKQILDTGTTLDKNPEDADASQRKLDLLQDAVIVQQILNERQAAKEGGSTESPTQPEQADRPTERAPEPRKATPAEIKQFGLNNLRAEGIKWERQEDGTFIVDVAGTIWDIEFWHDGTDWKWRVQGSDTWHPATTPIESVSEANWWFPENAKKVQQALARANTAMVYPKAPAGQPAGTSDDTQVESQPSTPARTVSFASKSAAGPEEARSQRPESDPSSSVEGKEDIPQWVPRDAVEAWNHPREWRMGSVGVYCVHEGVLYKNTIHGDCESYGEHGFVMHDGQYFDAEEGVLKDIPAGGCFDFEQQKWVTLDPEEEAERIAVLGPEIDRALKTLDGLAVSQQSYIENLQREVENQNWLQNFSNWLTDFKPYDMQLQNARMALSRINSTRQTFDERMENAQGLNDTLVASNALFRSVGMPEILFKSGDGGFALVMVEPDPNAYRLTKIDTSYLEIMEQNERNLDVTRDAIIDTALTVGTLGAGAGVNLLRKGGQIAGRKILATTVVKSAVRQGAATGAVYAGGSSLVKNIDEVQSGDKTLGEGVRSVAFDTALGAGLGGVIGKLTPKLGEKVQRVIERIRNRPAPAPGAAAGVADDVERIVKEGVDELTDDVARATKQAKEAAAREAQEAAAKKAAKEAADAKAAKEAKEAAAKAAKEAEEAARAKAAKEAQDAVNAKAAREAANATNKAGEILEQQVDDFGRQMEQVRSKFSGLLPKRQMQLLAREPQLVDAARKALGIAGDVTESVVNAAWRKAGVKFHPDKGADKAAYFKKATDARDLLMQYLEGFEQGVRRAA